MDFRAVARHEAGHAIGFDDEDRTLASMNSLYEHGSGVSHTGASGELPHGDDKAACRTLYPGSAAAYNVMATCWREPSGGGARKQSISGTVPAGNGISVPFYLENQSNRTVAGLANGVKVGIYLSTNNVISTGDMKIAEYPFTGDWPAHAQGFYNLGATVPSTTTAGTWYVGVIFDNTGVLGEQWEGDNAALIGSINVTNRPDYTISAMNVSNSSPVRGSQVRLTTRVTNAGYAPTQATSVHLYMSLAGTGGPDPWDFFLGAPAVPALQPGGFYDVIWDPVVPAELCAERTWFDLGSRQLDGRLVRAERQQQHATGARDRALAVGGRYYIGQTQTYVSTAASGPGNDYNACTKRVGAVDPNVFYFFLWTASGTAPGLPIPPFGVLPLNYDAVTDAGLQLYGSTLLGMYGPQTGASAGDYGTVVGGSWLAPIQNQATHFAAIYADLAAGIVGIAQDPIAMWVR